MKEWKDYQKGAIKSDKEDVPPASEEGGLIVEGKHALVPFEHLL